jgi:hypothetical protein
MINPLSAMLVLILSKEEGYLLARKQLDVIAQITVGSA